MRGSFTAFQNSIDFEVESSPQEEFENCFYVLLTVFNRQTTRYCDGVAFRLGHFLVLNFKYCAHLLESNQSFGL